MGHVRILGSHVETDMPILDLPFHAQLLHVRRVDLKDQTLHVDLARRSIHSIGNQRLHPAELLGVGRVKQHH